MTAMILDDGKAANLWKDMMIVKFLASTTVLINFLVPAISRTIAGTKEHDMQVIVLLKW